MSNYIKTSLSALILTMLTCMIGQATTAYPMMQVICVCAAILFTSVGAISVIISLWKE